MCCAPFFLLYVCLLVALLFAAKLQFSVQLEFFAVIPPVLPSITAVHMVRPTHDFHQTDDRVVVSIYTKRKDLSEDFTDQYVVADVQERQFLQIIVYMPYSGSESKFRFYQVCYKLLGTVSDEKPEVKVSWKSGKVEVKLKKDPVERWANLGSGLPGNDMHGDSNQLKDKLLHFKAFRDWVLVDKKAVTHDVNHYVFEPNYKVYMNKKIYKKLDIFFVSISSL